MEKHSLLKLFKKNDGKVSDKWESYLINYESIFREYINQQINIVEVGVQNGGSLEIWAKYFPNAKNIVGCDINELCRNLIFKDSRIKVIVGDIKQNETYKEIINILRGEKIDIFIDDGSHFSQDIIATFLKYFPLIKYGGIYIIEDLCCSYWKEFQGGLCNELSSISFLKILVDVINSEHWRVNKSQFSLIEPFIKKYNIELSEIDFLEEVHSISFYNSLCIIKKQRSIYNKLGKRIISGKDMPVAKVQTGIGYINIGSNFSDECDK